MLLADEQSQIWQTETLLTGAAVCFLVYALARTPGFLLEALR